MAEGVDSTMQEEVADDEREENVRNFNSPYTEEDFNNAIELNDEWQDDDLLCSSGGANMKNDGLKFGIPAKPDSLQFGDKSLTKKKISVQLSPDQDLSQTFDSEELSIDGLPTPDELTTPDDMESSPSDSPRRLVGVDLEWDNDTPIFSDNSISNKLAVSEQMGAVDAEVYRTVIIGDEEFKMDLTAIIPYKQVLSHGGYYGEGLNAIVVFSACYLPDCNQTDYDYIMDNLFLYVVSTLDLLVAEEYMIVFFNSGCKRRNVPRFAWLKRCYKMIHRRLRKSLKQLLLVHPSWYMRALITFFRPFISTKFSRKLKLVSSLKELSNIVSLSGLSIPDAVNAHDAKRYSSTRRVEVKKNSSENARSSISSQGVSNKIGETEVSP
uniref:protein prune homolog 2-like n=1 Tax=Styela clava TaxID=7725 RepID=UPI0019397A13|nr:protein prune homolog 2-like [Styela clava]